MGLFLIDQIRVLYFISFIHDIANQEIRTSHAI